MQRFMSQKVVLARVIVMSVTLASLSGLALAGDVAGTVGGGGQALVTGLDGTEVPLQFEIAAVVFRDGVAAGHTTFVFRKPFVQVWGAVPDIVDLVRLDAEITGAATADDGIVTLYGEFTERDISFSDGVVFEERDTDLTSFFKVVLNGPNAGAFSLQWCCLLSISK